jgi:glycosyltransferase involved in cell wall biosynthesis
MADSIIAITDGVRDDLVENFRIDKSRVLVVNNPIDLSQIKKSCNEKIDEPAVHTDNAIVLSVGRLSKEKGIDSLLSAFSTIHDRTDAHLVIIGTGPEENDLLSLANSLGIENKVSFIGYRVNPYSYMSKATILVLASRYEGLPMVVLEAMACGLPVVVTRCFPGVEEIVGDGGAGLIVDTNDESGLAEAIQKLLADSQLRERMALEGRVRAQRFAAETIARQYLKVLDGVEWAYVRNLRKS